jgi:hypothetical protein
VIPEETGAAGEDHSLLRPVHDHASEQVYLISAQRRHGDCRSSIAPKAAAASVSGNWPAIS